MRRPLPQPSWRPADRRVKHRGKNVSVVGVGDYGETTLTDSILRMAPMTTPRAKSSNDLKDGYYRHPSGWGPPISSQQLVLQGRPDVT